MGMLVSGKAQKSWEIELDDLGTFSSPRVADFNQDGVLDIVMGAGRQEFLSCDTAVFALNGKNGEMLWKVSARDQIFGSANLMDINEDGVPDVFIGGRSAELKAIDGKSGKVIWEFLPEGDSISRREQGWYNFYNPQFVPDQNGDQVMDLLVSNGGDVIAAPYDAKRPAGSLLLIDPLTGTLLSKAMMPDDKEIYMSVVSTDLDGDGTWEVIFGTGGETLGGNLFRCSLADVRQGDLTGAKLLAKGENKGFIAPPVLADINKDEIKDIIVNSVDGRMLAFDGKNDTLLWGGQIPDTEAYSSLAVGDVTGDRVPDFLGVYAIGVWPDLKGNRPLVVDGSSGELLLIDSLGFYQISSPIIGDFNADGNNDALLSVNFFLPNEEQNKTIHNTLLVYDFARQGKYAITEPEVGSNVSSTPWVGDLDQDGLMDILYCQMTTPDKTYTYDGFRIKRIATDIPLSKPVSWGAYMGNQYNGVFNKE